MNSHVRFFFGLLFPMFIMVALVRIAMNDMVVWASIWSIWTLILTVAGCGRGHHPRDYDETQAGKKVGEK